MQSRSHERKLLVEGDDDKRVIPELMEANGIKWGETAKDAIVFIESLGGYQEILKPGLIQAELKASGLRILGVLLDANSSAETRWQELRQRCVPSFPNIPHELPEDGLIVENSHGKRFGTWLLPDNRSRGMMETFLSFLVPSQQGALWDHAVQATDEARHHGAGFGDAHHHKACIHSWLAWCDPPGRQLHQAIIERILDPNSPYAQEFVNWFQNLYELD